MYCGGKYSRSLLPNIGQRCPFTLPHISKKLIFLNEFLPPRVPTKKQIYQGIRYMSHLPLTGNHPPERHPFVLLTVRIVRFTMFRGQHQIWFPGRYKQTCCDPCKDQLTMKLQQPLQKRMSKRNPNNIECNLLVFRIIFRMFHLFCFP